MRSFRTELIAVVALLGVTSVSAAQAATITSLFNTGVNNLGTPLSDGTVGDPHYSLVSVPAGSTSDILVRTSAGGYPIPPYLGDDSVSAWIGPNNDSALDGPAGTYEYQTTFTLAGLNPATATITGGWSSDNNGLEILLNGNNTGNPGTDFTQFNDGFASFTIDSGFVAGVNTLDFLVNNSMPGGYDPTALRVEMTGTAAATPLPSTWTMMLIGLLAFGFIAYHRQPSDGLAA